MRRVLLNALTPLILSLLVIDVSAQNDRFAYAITDMKQDGVNWTALRKLDLNTGQYSDVLLNGTDLKTAVFDASTRKQLVQQPDAKWGTLVQTPFSTGVAAAAFDRDHNRLYFTPMFVDQLRYIDLKTMKVYYVTDQSFTGVGNMHNDEAKVITRMVIAPDGYGYAINNDGSSLIRFNTSGRKLVVEQLGTLVDDPANKGISIHNRCSSFGGDMISDDKGNLFILTAPNHVFKVNIQTKVATHMGSIQGLPANFTTNGAVVDGDGNLLVSSAVNSSSYFVVNPKDWTASAYKAAGVFKSSDLANSNFLSTTARVSDMTLITRPEEKFSKLISVYPNPVTTNELTLQFSKVPKGDYTIELTDVIGRSIMQRKVTIAAESQTQSMSLNGSNAKGIYMVKVFDTEKQSVFTQKVMVQ